MPGDALEDISDFRRRKTDFLKFKQGLKRVTAVFVCGYAAQMLCGKLVGKSFGLSGGVANNLTLRDALERTAKKYRAKFLPAERKYCGDNAAMIAFAAYIDPDSCFKSEANTLKLEPSRPLA